MLVIIRTGFTCDVCSGFCDYCCLCCDCCGVVVLNSDWSACWDCCSVCCLPMMPSLSLLDDRCCSMLLVLRLLVLFVVVTYHSRSLLLFCDVRYRLSMPGCCVFCVLIFFCSVWKIARPRQAHRLSILHVPPVIVTMGMLYDFRLSVDTMVVTRTSKLRDLQPRTFSEVSQTVKVGVKVRLCISEVVRPFPLYTDIVSQHALRRAQPLSLIHI